jgi:hypothetical protein
MDIKNWICTAYFQGIDGLGTCNTKCSWYNKEGCPAAKGCPKWDGLEHYTKRK